MDHWLLHDREWHGASPPAELLERRTVVYTPTVTATPRTIEVEVERFIRRVGTAIELELHPDRAVLWTHQHTELIIINEADRLKAAALEREPVVDLKAGDRPGGDALLDAKSTMPVRLASHVAHIPAVQASGLTWRANSDARGTQKLGTRLRRLHRGLFLLQAGQRSL